MTELIPLEYEKILDDQSRGEYYFMIMNKMCEIIDRMEYDDIGDMVVKYKFATNFKGDMLLIVGQMYWDEDICETVTEVIELYELTIDEFCEMKNAGVNGL